MDASPGVPAAKKRASFPRRALAFVGKLLIGVSLCMTLLSSVLVVGWSYALARRSALRYWWRRLKPREDKVSFRAFAEEHPSLSRFATSPAWIFRRAKADPWPLWEHFRLGLLGLLCTLSLTLLPTSILWFAWYSGWDNSFNKGYEQTAVGLITSFIGIALLIPVLSIVPLAQARLAINGRAKTFFAFDKLRQVVRRRWLASAFLGLGYLASGIPIMVLRSLLGGADAAGFRLDLGSRPPTEVLRLANLFFWGCGFYLFPAWLFLRCWAARIYAGGVLALLAEGRWTQQDLTEQERSLLDQLPPLAPVRSRSLWPSRVGRFVLALPVLLAWFAFVGQTYIAQFFGYQNFPSNGWVIHPLIHAPHFRHIPAPLRKAAKEYRKAPREGPWVY